MWFFKPIQSNVEKAIINVNMIINALATPTIVKNIGAKRGVDIK